MSAPEELFSLHLRAAKLPTPVREYRFHPVRKFRFDFAYPEKKLAIEIDGATYSNGRHNRGKGYEADCFKMALALSLGWSVYRFTSGQVADGTAISFIEKHFHGRVSADKN
jgi:very-short-patch-repair endonuclease